MERENPAPLAGGNRAGIGFAEQQSFTRQPAEKQLPWAGMVLTGWTPRTAPGVFRGNASVTLPAIGLAITVAVFRNANGSWVSLPSTELRDKAGQPLLDSQGKRRYRNDIRWLARDLQDGFSAAVISAIIRQHGSDALDGDRP
jgi:hypothetical protein